MRLKPGDTYKSEATPITQEMIDEFAWATGDVNPLHINPEYAKGAMFGKTIAHGMLIGALVSSVLGIEWPGAGTIYMSQTLYFHRPVFPGDCVQVYLKVLGAEGKRGADILVSVKNQSNVEVLSGRAKVILPEDWSVADEETQL